MTTAVMPLMPVVTSTKTLGMRSVRFSELQPPQLCPAVMVTNNASESRLLRVNRMPGCLTPVNKDASSSKTNLCLQMSAVAQQHVVMHSQAHAVRRSETKTPMTNKGHPGLLPISKAPESRPLRVNIMPGMPLPCPMMMEEPLHAPESRPLRVTVMPGTPLRHNLPPNRRHAKRLILLQDGVYQPFSNSSSSSWPESGRQHILDNALGPRTIVVPLTMPASFAIVITTAVRPFMPEVTSTETLGMCRVRLQVPLASH